MTTTQRENLETSLMLLQELGYKKMCNDENLTDDQLCVFTLIDVQNFVDKFWNLVEENNKLKAIASDHIY